MTAHPKQLHDFGKASPHRVSQIGMDTADECACCSDPRSCSYFTSGTNEALPGKSSIQMWRSTKIGVSANAALHSLEPEPYE